MADDLTPEAFVRKYMNGALHAEALNDIKALLAARATAAEATLARYREALERARDLLRGSSNILNEASAFAIIDAALLPSPAAETEEKTDG